MDQADQRAEDDRAKSGDDADDDRQKRQPHQPEPQWPPDFIARDPIRGRALQSWRIEPKSQAEPLGFSPILIVVSLTKV